MTTTGNRTILPLQIEDLLLNQNNPRVEPTFSQRGALKAMIEDQGDKLVKLATSIVERGLNPGELIWVKDNGNGTYTVLEGNRRTAATKLLNNPELLDSMELDSLLEKKFRNLLGEGSTAPERLMCVVLAEDDAADEWLRLRHGGQLGGEGLISWSAVSKQRFEKSTPALQALDHVKAGTFLSPTAKATADQDFNLTTVSRLVGNPSFRNSIGISVEDSQLQVSDTDALARLSIVFNDIAEGNLPVSKVMSANQRESYGKEISNRPLPTSTKADSSSKTKKASTKSGPTKKKTVRTTLIPKALSIEFSATRVEEVFDELQRLNLNQFPNSAAVLFRVLTEMSVDTYCTTHNIPTVGTNGRTHTLRERIKAVTLHLEANGVRSKKEMRGIRAASGTSGQLMSVDTWNEYVHNQYISPAPTDLRKLWDSVESFVSGIWE